MDPTIWGPPLWKFLHSIPFAYGADRLQATPKEQKHMYTFLESLKHVLPCSCKLNYKKHFKENPPRLNNRRELFEWLVDLHNTVNMEFNTNSKNNGKPLKKLYTYKEVEQMYIQLYQ